jgi:hypothetical protein
MRCVNCSRCGPPRLRRRARTSQCARPLTATIVDVEYIFVLALVLPGLLIAGACLFVIYRLLRA